MNRQKSFDNKASTLYVVATPIGNLQEITPRALEILSTVSYIAAEDTRNTQKLLRHFDIQTRCIAHHAHNEYHSSDGLVKLLEEGNDVALVSDAGYPLISDPGQEVVAKVIQAGFNVVPISGSNAMLNALVASGICPQPFLFYGFLNASEKSRLAELELLKDQPYTIIFYEAPHRIKKMLHSCLSVFGNRSICLARELTKKHEEFIRGTLTEVLDIVDDLKGEMVVVVEPPKKEKETISDIQIKKEIENFVLEGFTSKEAMKKVSQIYGIAKNELYRIHHDLDKKNDQT